jgi:hypothetical protein
MKSLKILLISTVFITNCQSRDAILVDYSVKYFSENLLYKNIIRDYYNNQKYIYINLYVLKELSRDSAFLSGNKIYFSGYSRHLSEPFAYQEKSNPEFFSDSTWIELRELEEFYVTKSIEDTMPYQVEIPEKLFQLSENEELDAKDSNQLVIEVHKPINSSLNKYVQLEVLYPNGSLVLDFYFVFSLNNEYSHFFIQRVGLPSMFEEF